MLKYFILKYCPINTVAAKRFTVIYLFLIATITNMNKTLGDYGLHFKYTFLYL